MRKIKPLKGLLTSERALEQAIDDGKEVECVFFKKGFNSDNYHKLKSRLLSLNIPTKTVPLVKLSRICANHQGLVAIPSLIDYYSLDIIIPQLFAEGEVPLILLLDRITDIRNVAAIIRSAEALGVHAIVIPMYERALINDEVIKISTGAALKIPLVRYNKLKNALGFLKLSGLQIVALDEKGTVFIGTTDLTCPTAIIVGSEKDGISKENLSMCDSVVQIPTLGYTQSLNASVAASIAFYEAVRQRQL